MAIIAFKPTGEGEAERCSWFRSKKQALTRAQFEQLAEVPPEEEWLANITNAKTRRAYKNDVREFVAFAGLHNYAELRSIVRSHIIGWRKDMERRELEPATIRRKLSALSSLFEYLCERNAVSHNPVDGVKRPMANGNEGSTPALGDRQVRKLLEAPPADTLEGVRDRAILATLLYHGIRREELCGLRVKDLHSRQGVMHFRVKGKRAKIRFVPVNAAAQRTIEEYLALAGHRGDLEGALFRPVKNNRTGRLDRHLDPGSVYRNIMCKYGAETGISAEVIGLCVHSLRATAATNALSHDSDIAKVQEWLGHANISTARLYDREKPAGGQPVASGQILVELARTLVLEIVVHRPLRHTCLNALNNSPCPFDAIRKKAFFNIKRHTGTRRRRFQ